MNNYTNGQVYNIRRNGRVVPATYSNGRFTYTHRRTNITINEDAVEVLPDNYVEPYHVEPPPQTPLRGDGEYYWVRHNGQWIVALWSGGSFQTVGIVPFDYLHNIAFDENHVRHIVRPEAPNERMNLEELTDGMRRLQAIHQQERNEDRINNNDVTDPEFYGQWPVGGGGGIAGQLPHMGGNMAHEQTPRVPLTDEEFREMVAQGVQQMRNATHVPQPAPEIPIDYPAESTLRAAFGLDRPTSSTEECDWI